jgi:hypothetical protein
MRDLFLSRLRVLRVVVKVFDWDHAFFANMPPGERHGKFLKPGNHLIGSWFKPGAFKLWVNLCSPTSSILCKPYPNTL